ncbi:phosphoribosylglycinamide formyltransferase [Prevotella lacticifex]|uniref:Phosphoribosylglycinamide formyltransferase n=1 Tax=Prevotella lacticifex TaxID=2854755 RepID=A0A9R1CXR8_9BACT|nr:phosphoribosylglycinamide formyltransferase [Prevotella lacticifex]GJG35108.1 phosphoribosylglycinamide formyltransferase [Prevotella lacticifex]GJG39841.1 phosphoribosylglycinamide formyltransferase [Prevotella lacticifex]GJG41477.1 phosphoribosylglycinamide formyltransferase [Prevotella lacticifex]GJG46195.1 phosphoribosylglycinamide formyltransferase [Prevotella lacticifex]GJG47829.1 phosphoribosylglycinamide formyltransferase [Prevotella lacticifex]
MEERKRIAIFASGNGTNCENIIRYFQAKGDAEIAFVLSNKADAYALVRARRLGVKTVVMARNVFNDELAVMELMRREHVGFIVLAGFLLLVPPFLIDAFDHRMVNIHPALLPKYGGKGMYGRHVHEAVKAAGESETGMTVHWVTREYDSGAIIAQYKTAISPTDTVDDIAAKEHDLEMKYFPEVIDRIISGL